MRRIALVVSLAALCLAAPESAAGRDGWRPHVREARSYAAQRAGEVAFAVRTRHGAWGSRSEVQYRSASLVKAMLLVAYLRGTEVRGRALSAAERALLNPMVRRSDNRAADAVHARVGLPALTALARAAGMRAFLAHPVWGGSLVTAADQARFFRRVDRLVPRRHRAFALELLRGIIPAQRWGLPQALPDGWRIAFKGGWGRGVTRQVTHQAALLTRGRRRIGVAVLTADNPSVAYGGETLRGVAARLLRGLDGRLVGRTHAVRSGLGRGQLRRSDFSR